MVLGGKLVLPEIGSLIQLHFGLIEHSISLSFPFDGCGGFDSSDKSGCTLKFLCLFKIL